MDNGIQWRKQHLPLRVAAALLHIRVVGKSPDARDSPAMRATLNDAARALSLVAPIYYHDPAAGLPVQVPESQLMGANFSGGGDVLIAADGTQYKRLTVKRTDLESAGEILRASSTLQNRWVGRTA